VVTRHTPATVAIVLALATVLLVGGVVGLWLQRQALDTDRWVDTSSRMLENETIRTTVADFLVGRVAADDEPQEEDGVLGGLGEIASGPLREAAADAAVDALGSAPARTAWAEANRAAHRVLVDLVEGRIAPGGEVRLDMTTLAGQVAAAVAVRTGLAENRSPPDASVAILHSGQLDRTQDVARILSTLTWVLLGLAVALIAWAIALHPDRLRAVGTVGGCLLVAGVAVLALRWAGGRMVVGDLAGAPETEPAAHAAWAIATSLLAWTAVGLMVAGAALAAGAWLAIRRRSAPSARRAGAPA
jgi:hypothetical protein